MELKTYTGPDKLTAMHSGAQINHAQRLAVDMEVSRPHSTIRWHNN